MLRALVAAISLILSSHSTSVTRTDATSTLTAKWACVRLHESTNSYTAPHGGAYQMQGPAFASATGLDLPAQVYSPTVQDRSALAVYAQAVRYWRNGWHPWRADAAICHLGIGS